MNRKLLIIVGIVFIALLAVSGVYAASANQKEEAKNVLEVDCSINPVTGDWSCLGFLPEQLYALGFTRLDTELIFKQLNAMGFKGLNPENIAKERVSFAITIDSTQVASTVNYEPLLNMYWDENDRGMVLAILVAFANNFGEDLNFSFTEDQAERVEHWAGTSEIKVRVRFTDRLWSRQLDANFSDSFYLDVDTEKAELGIEGFLIPLPEGDAIEKGMGVVSDLEAENARICWEDGVLYTEINGKELPVIEVNSGGIEVLYDVFPLVDGSLDKVFDSSFGLDVAVDGEEHTGAECGTD